MQAADFLGDSDTAAHLSTALHNAIIGSWARLDKRPTVDECELAHQVWPAPHPRDGS